MADYRDSVASADTLLLLLMLQCLLLQLDELQLRLVELLYQYEKEAVSNRLCLSLFLGFFKYLAVFFKSILLGYVCRFFWAFLSI